MLHFGSILPDLNVVGEHNASFIAAFNQKLEALKRKHDTAKRLLVDAVTCFLSVVNVSFATIVIVSKAIINVF